MSRNSKMGMLISSWTNTKQGNIPLVKISVLQSVGKMSTARIYRMKDGKSPVTIEVLKLWRDGVFIPKKIREVCRAEIERIAGITPTLFGPLDVNGDGRTDAEDVRALDVESAQLAVDGMKCPHDLAIQETNAAAQVVIANTKREILRRIA